MPASVRIRRPVQMLRATRSRIYDFHLDRARVSFVARARGPQGSFVNKREVGHMNRAIRDHGAGGRLRSATIRTRVCMKPTVPVSNELGGVNKNWPFPKQR